MKNFFLVIFALALIALPFNLKAQQVIASAGGYYQSEDLSLSWTVGEPVVETFTGSNVILTQGFQQPYSFYLQQILNIPMGWSGISSYLNPVNKDVAGLFAPYENDLVIMASLDGIYFPTQSINSIGNWDYLTGYQVKAENDFNLIITGTKIENPEIDLMEGWNLIPVLSSCDVDVENLFSGFTSLQIIKEVAGTHIYWPEYNINTLINLIPGKAYFVASQDAGQVTFPACTKSSPIKQATIKPANNTPWNDLHYTVSTHIIAIPAGALAVSGVKAGHIIGAFTPDGICAGRLEISNPNANTAISTFANDEITPAIDGFEPSEMLHFKVYSPATNQEFNLEVTFDPALPNMGLFEAHGLSAVQSLKLQALGTDENADIKFEVYPNPSHGQFMLTMNTWPENLQIQITDMRGSIIQELEPGVQNAASVFNINLSDQTKGVYFLKLLDDGIVVTKKLVVN